MTVTERQQQQHAQLLVLAAGAVALEQGQDEQERRHERIDGGQGERPEHHVLAGDVVDGEKAGQHDAAGQGHR